MRPKFQSDTCYIPIHDGVYLRNNHGGLMLKGKSLHGLLQHLIPILDGNATLDEITDGLDAGRKQMIVNLVEKLYTHHFLRDTGQDQPQSIPLSELETYSSDFTFIASFQDAAARAFMRFLNQRLLIIGSGLCFSSLVQASLQRGIRHIGVSTEDIATTSDLKHQDLLSASTPGQTVQEIAALPWDDEAGLLQIIQDYDAVLHVSDQPMLARVQLLNRLCTQQKCVFMQALVIADHAWIGPLVHPTANACWECAWRRLQSNLVPLASQLPLYAFDAQPSVLADQPPVTKTAAGVIANRLFFEVFKYFTQIDNLQDSSQLIDLDLGTFQSKSHAFLPHPLCQADQHPVVPTALQFLEQLRSLQCHPSIDADMFFSSITPCINELLGILTTADAGDFVQLPLMVYQVQVSNPMLLERQYEPLTVTATGLDATTARLRASQTACECYLAEVVDRRRLLTLEQVQQQALPTIATAHLINPLCPPPAHELWTWAFNLHNTQACLVPASQVFHALHHQRVQPRGIASGMNWNEAVCRALLDWCNYLTIDQLSNSPQPYPQVDLTKTPLTAEGTHLYQLLNIACGQFTVYDVTGPLHVPTFALCVKDKVIAYSTHCDVALALQMGLEQALQHYQSIQFQQSAYPSAPLVDLPRTLRGEQRYVPAYSCPASWSDQLAWLVQTLQSHKICASVVPLDHDPALAKIFPYVVRVLLSWIEV
ncbi:TOMM precursor leader peptide-binding protein [Dictyobacter formicarum]|nr:TOMM precursor leader peptide-binding protein [Dictyobacter formicarum]